MKQKDGRYEFVITMEHSSWRKKKKKRKSKKKEEKQKIRKGARGTYYTIEGRIRYREIDHHGTVTLPGIINYFQDCSTFQSEDIGEGRALATEAGVDLVVLASDRGPLSEDGRKITVGTFSSGFHGAFGKRNFQDERARGEGGMRHSPGYIWMWRAVVRCVRIGEEIGHTGKSRRLRCCMRGGRLYLERGQRSPGISGAQISY